MTRQAILERAVGLATEVGLEGVTIGRLAEDLDLSKSGLFAHFGSKEALQVQTLEYAAERFVELVIRPALAAPRGEPRVKALFENIMRWPKLFPQPGGCSFVAATFALDDQPGPARDQVVKLQRGFLDVIAGAVRLAIAEGHFRKDVDPEQFAFDLYGIMLMTQMGTRLLGASSSGDRARSAFAALLAAARPLSLKTHALALSEVSAIANSTNVRSGRRALALRAGLGGEPHRSRPGRSVGERPSSPARHPAPRREQAVLREGAAFDVPFAKGRLRAWRWGEGPTVLLVHGWGGRGGQLTPFVAPLRAAGFSVVAFDGPAHGASHGRIASVPLFAKAVHALSAHVGTVRGIVAHSMGAAGSAVALVEGLRVEASVFVGPPRNPAHFFQEFAEPGLSADGA
jgi:AcrR family transcriptional regulator